MHDGAVYDVAKKLGGYAVQAVEILREAGGGDNPGGWLGMPGGSLPAIRATMNTRASMALLPSGPATVSSGDTSFQGDYRVAYQSQDGRCVDLHYWYVEDYRLGAIAVQIEGLSPITSWVEVPRTRPT